MACARVSVLALLAALPFSQVSAEITLDGTMGTAGQLPGPDFTIAHTDGNTQGANLFHSFSVFNIASTESATFTGPAGYDNVVSRVTGGTASSIDGLFRSTVPGADFYFINPAGVVFGQNATLDVPGAFHTSTADELRFADDNVFSASNPNATVLTAAAPAAFGFLSSNPAGITLNDSKLAVSTGKTLSLVGGSLGVVGTDRNAASPHLSTPSGQLNLVSVRSPGGVTITGGALDAGGFAAHGDIALVDSRLDVSGSPGGSVYIEGGNIVVDSSHIWSDNSGPAGGGNIAIKGTSIFVDHEDLRVSSSSPAGIGQPRIRATTSDSGTGGSILIEGDSVTLNRGYRIYTQTTGSGQGGDIRWDVTGPMEIRDTTYVYASTEGSGRGGDHTVNADTLTIVGELTSGRWTGLDAESGFYDPNAGAPGNVLVTVDTLDISGGRAEIVLSNHGAQVAGTNTVNARHIVLREGANFISASMAGSGEGADVIVNTDRLEVLGGKVQTIAFSGTGPAGDVYINADSILVAANGHTDSTTRISSFSVFAPGNAGSVFVDANSLEIRDGMIFASTLGTGDSGSVTIAVDSLLLDGGGTIFPKVLQPPQTPADCACLTAGSTHISASSSFDTSGASGKIDITANTVTVRGGAAINASTASINRGGDVTISADSILIDTDGRIDTGSIGLGDGGDISLSARNVMLANGGNLVASSIGSTGNAGDIFVSATESFRSNGGFVSTEAVSSDGGNITINAVTMVDLLNSSITTSVGSGAGAGGNINIDPQFVIVQNSNIIANAFGGPGGNINIVAGLFLIDPSSTISASSQLGINGIINVNSPVADVTSGVTELPAEALDASTLVQAQCAAQAGGTSSLTSAGRSGLPAGPDRYLPSAGFGLATGPTAAADATPIPISVRDAIDGGQALRLAMTGLECT